MQCHVCSVLIGLDITVSLYVGGLLLGRFLSVQCCVLWGGLFFSENNAMNLLQNLCLVMMEDMNFILQTNTEVMV